MSFSCDSNTLLLSVVTQIHSSHRHRVESLRIPIQWYALDRHLLPRMLTLLTRAQPQTPRTPGGTDDLEALKVLPKTSPPRHTSKPLHHVTPQTHARVAQAQMAECEANEQFTQAVAIKDKVS